MGRIRECLLICFIVVSFFVISVSIVFVITFLSPSILGLEDIEIKGDSDFVPIKIESNNSRTLTGSVPDSTTTSSPPIKTVSAGITPSPQQTSTTIKEDHAIEFDARTAAIVFEDSSDVPPLPSRKLYAGDDLMVVNAQEDAGEADVLLDGNMLGKTADSTYVIRELAGGQHTLSLRGAGTLRETSLAVWDTRYGLSQDVRVLLSGEERDAVIRAGKANLRFYDIPNCPNCIVMRPKVAKIAEDFRHCVAYELVNLWKPSVREDLKKDFPDQSKVVTPVIMVEGVGGRFSYMGVVPPEKLVENIMAVAPACR